MSGSKKRMCRILKFVNVNRTCWLATFLFILSNSVLFEKCEGYQQDSAGLFQDKFILESIVKQNSSNIANLPNRRNFSNLDQLNSKGSRHRRARSAKPVAEVIGSSSLNSGSSFRIAEEQVQNSHKPIFARCDEYQPSVKEESARGKNSTNISILLQLL